MELRKGFRQMRRTPMFPLRPLLPLGLIGGVVTLGVLNYRRAMAVERKVDRLLDEAGVSTNTSVATGQSTDTSRSNVSPSETAAPVA